LKGCTETEKNSQEDKKLAHPKAKESKKESTVKGVTRGAAELEKMRSESRKRRHFVGYSARGPSIINAKKTILS